MNTITRKEAVQRYEINRMKLVRMLKLGEVEGYKPPGRTAAWQINEDSLKMKVSPRGLNVTEVVENGTASGFMSIIDAGRKYDINASTLRDWVAKGKLPATLEKSERGHLGYHINPSDLEVLLASGLLRKRGRPKKIIETAQPATTEWITVPEAAQISHLEPSVLRNRAFAGKIPLKRIKVGNSTRILLDRAVVAVQPPLLTTKTGVSTIVPTAPEITGDLSTQLQSIAALVQTGLFTVETLEVTLKFSQEK